LARDFNSSANGEDSAAKYILPQRVSGHLFCSTGMPPIPVSNVDRDREQGRLEALRRYAVLDTGPEREFDELVKRAARACGYPVALLTLMDAQRCWFKAATGLPESDRAARELPREQTFCNHAFRTSGIFVVPDARADERFAGLPTIARPGGFRAYAGAQLITPDGHSIGTLCLLDHVPREPTQRQRDALRAFAECAMALLEVRRHGLMPAPPVVVISPEPRHAVLVVDDEAAVRQLVENMLEARGAVVFGAGNGAEALATYRQHAAQIGLVLTDLNMPVLGGLALIGELRQEPAPPVIAVMSGRLDSAMGAELAKLAIARVLAKPFSLGEIDRLLTLVRA